MKTELLINMINQIKFIYNIANDTCYIQVSNRPVQELTIKGTTEQNGLVTGTWFQVDDQINHWVSFKKDKFQANKWEVFYKSVSQGEIRYYRRLFLGVKETLTLAFSERDEWVKIDGKWRSKF